MIRPRQLPGPLFSQEYFYIWLWSDHEYTIGSTVFIQQLTIGIIIIQPCCFIYQVFELVTGIFWQTSLPGSYEHGFNRKRKTLITEGFSQGITKFAA